MTESPFIFHVLISFGAFQALFLALVFLLRPGKTLARTCFALFLLIEGFTLVERLLFETGLIEQVPHLLGISFPINFLKPPILLFMALAIANSKFKLRPVHSLHLIPFVLMIFMNLPLYGMPGEEKYAFVNQFMNYVPGYDDFQFYFNLSFFFNIGAYLVVAMYQLKKYRVHIPNDQLANWYYKTLLFYTGALALGMLYYLQKPAELIEIPLFNIISMLAMSFMIQSIAYRFFVSSNALNITKPPIKGTAADWSKDEQRILEKLEQEKVYLSDSLSLDEFAQSLDLPKKYVSELINLKFGKNFKSLLNHYRVEAAKNMMAHEAEDFQLIDVGLESGFNNKVSFYRVFKQHTGQSPSEYMAGIRRHRSQQKNSLSEAK